MHPTPDQSDPHRPHRPHRAHLSTLATLAALAWLAGALGVPGSPAPAAARTAATGSYVLADTWASAGGALPADAWRRASGVDVTADGRIWIADADERRLSVIGSDGQAHILAAPDGSGNGLLEPGHLKVDLAGDRLYVVDPQLDALVVFKLDGTRVATWGNIPGAAGVAVMDDGNIVVSAGDTGELMLYSPDGFRIAKWLAVQPASGGDLVRGVDVDQAGQIYVLDRIAHKVVVFDINGRKQDSISLANLLDTTDVRDLAVAENPPFTPYPMLWFATSVGLYRLDPPQDEWQPFPVGGNLTAVAAHPKVGVVAVAPDRRGLGSTISKLDPGAQPGDRPTRWGGIIARLGQFSQPERLVVGADGRAYVLDLLPRVQRFALDGSVLGQMQPDRFPPVVVDAGADGTLFVTDGAEIRAYEPGSNGQTTRWQQPVAPAQVVMLNQGGHASGLVVDRTTGDVVALDTISGSLRRYSPVDGTAVGFQKKLQESADGSSVWADLKVDAANTLYILDRSNRTVHTLAADGVERLIQLPSPARRIAVGPMPGAGAGPGAQTALFTLDRDGWVRRFSIAGAAGPGPAGATIQAVPSTVFDATRFDLSTTTRPTDLAIDQAGDVYVTDRYANVVSHFRWDANATAQELPTGPTCRGFGAKTANPAAIDFGQTVNVQLTIRGGCGADLAQPPEDILLILDRSASMTGQRMNVMREAALNFVAEVDFTTAQVGVLSFTNGPKLEARLGAPERAVRDAIQQLVVDPNGQTAINVALAGARDEMNRRGRRGQAKPVFILISDGGSDLISARDEAQKAKDDGIEIYTIGIQTVGPVLRAVATDDEHFFLADNALFLYAIFEQILERVTASALFRSLTLVDEIPANMRYIQGSDVPTGTLAANTFTWQVAGVPIGGMALRYRLQPLEAGCWPTNVRAWATYVDGFGNPGRLDFPVPRVCVHASNVPTETPLPPTITPTPRPTDTPRPTNTPRPTPTPTLTVTPTPTPVPQPIYIPLILREKCTPGQRYADVILVIDTSGSMAGAPLNAAKEASRQFVAQLNLPKDQVGLVSFNNEVKLVSQLTGNRVQLEAAISGLAVQSGTRIHLGLQAAVDELSSPRHVAANTPVIVLLTDGVGQDPDLAMAVATGARDAGIRIFAIGLGTDVDLAILQALAGSRSRTYLAPSPAELAGIYRQVAGEVPCPTEGYWGRR